MHLSDHEMSKISFFIKRIQSSPMGAVVLVTKRRLELIHAFEVACDLMGRKGFIIHPSELDIKLMGLELSCALIDKRAHAYISPEQNDLLVSRVLRAPGTSMGMIKYVGIPW